MKGKQVFKKYYLQQKQKSKIKKFKSTYRTYRKKVHWQGIVKCPKINNSSVANARIAIILSTWETSFSSKVIIILLS